MSPSTKLSLFVYIGIAGVLNKTVGLMYILQIAVVVIGNVY